MPEVREKAPRSIVDKEFDGAPPTGVMQVVDAKRINTIDQGAQPCTLDLEPKAMPATEGDVGGLFVAAWILVTGGRAKWKSGCAT